MGRLVVDAAAAAGHTTTIVSRSHGVDLTTGAGLADAVRGVSVVIDVSNVTTTSKKKSIAFFGAVTRNLIDAEQRAGVAHHVALSIVGVDRIGLGYHQGKRFQEELVLAGPVPGTVLRATQFHEFAGQLLDRVKGPVALVPRMRSQPIAAAEVAQALVHQAELGPIGLAPELAGPDQWEMPDMVRRLLQVRGSHRITLALPVPGAAGRQLAAGGLLPLGPGPRGEQTFEQWLAASGVAG
jgi:uncharacterized protein YbjT (DUF2867 family)